MISVRQRTFYIDVLNKLKDEGSSISEWASKAFSDKDFLTVFLKLVNGAKPDSYKDLLDDAPSLSEDEFKEKIYTVLSNAIK
ncbi:hypothetical protein C3744_29820 [Priestia megaterium]|uniref:Uncharacterized protein n=1 Tax=Priestia megaterium TaxID=1404 RepID=A0A3D8WTY2_PRIMG|nr:hypothetical protein [Priestia megaterium]MDH3169299.1 hypothetical protein [Priestia megaterium]RDZ05231.1 hypothetical protein C3744_29820 [Priestia megaterium]